ncbi:hypothetical protein BC830DRAFT_1109743 [Chytriomyces sp. MP71]|nr:hypothetical protein BC830DRAFT_1109743 [Chytriomyces sp. MP71]
MLNNPCLTGSQGSVTSPFEYNFMTLSEGPGSRSTMGSMSMSASAPAKQMLRLHENKDPRALIHKAFDIWHSLNWKALEEMRTRQDVTKKFVDWLAEQNINSKPDEVEKWIQEMVTKYPTGFGEWFQRAYPSMPEGDLMKQKSLLSSRAEGRQPFHSNDEAQAMIFRFPESNNVSLGYGVEVDERTTFPMPEYSPRQTLPCPSAKIINVDRTSELEQINVLNTQSSTGRNIGTQKLATNTAGFHCTNHFPTQFTATNSPFTSMNDSALLETVSPKPKNVGQRQPNSFTVEPSSMQNQLQIHEQVQNIQQQQILQNALYQQASQPQSLPLQCNSKIAHIQKGQQASQQMVNHLQGGHQSHFLQHSYQLKQQIHIQKQQQQQQCMQQQPPHLNRAQFTLNAASDTEETLAIPATQDHRFTQLSQHIQPPIPQPPPISASRPSVQTAPTTPNYTLQPLKLTLNTLKAYCAIQNQYTKMRNHEDAESLTGPLYARTCHTAANQDRTRYFQEYQLLQGVGSFVEGDRLMEDAATVDCIFQMDKRHDIGVGTNDGMVEPEKRSFYGLLTEFELELVGSCN